MTDEKTSGRNRTRAGFGPPNETAATGEAPRPHWPANHRQPPVNPAGREESTDRIMRLQKEENPARGGSAPRTPPGARPHPGHREITEIEWCKCRAKDCEAPPLPLFASHRGTLKMLFSSGIFSDLRKHRAEPYFFQPQAGEQNPAHDARFSRTCLHTKSASAGSLRGGAGCVEEIPRLAFLHGTCFPP